MSMKQTTDAEKSTKFVLSAIDTHGEILEEGILAVLGPFAEPGEKLTVKPLVKAIRNRMEYTLSKSIEASSEHEKELANDPKEREEARGARETLYDKVVSVRKIIDANLEPGAATRLQATGITPQATFDLLTYARNVGTALCDETITVATKEGVAIDRLQLGKNLLSLADTLEKEQTDVTLEIRKAEQTQVAKWEKSEEHIAAFVQGTSVISALALQGGNVYLASRLRPSESQRGSVDNVDQPLPLPAPPSS